MSAASSTTSTSGSFDVDEKSSTVASEDGSVEGRSGTGHPTTSAAPDPVSEVVQDKQSDSPAEDEVELVIGITRAMGTPTDAVIEQLRNSLSNYGYETELIKVSKLIEDDFVFETNEAVDPRPHKRYKTLIDHGNALCERNGRQDELALRAVDSIREHRGSLLQPASAAGSGPDLGVDRVESAEPPRGVSGEVTAVGIVGEEVDAFSISRRAYIIDSLKRVDEVTTLRNVYGDHFILIGLQATERVRRDSLTATFDAHGVESGEPAKEARRLMEIDWSEPVPYGQDMLRTFPMADVFIDVNKRKRAVFSARRTVALLFGDPEAAGPTREEFAMQVATQTQTLSPELGLRVGAVILAANGDVLAVGTNQHPTDPESPEYDAGVVDLRHMTADALKRLAGQGVLTQEVEDRINENPEGFAADLLKGALKGSDLRGLTEYQRPVHAEMNALIAALRQEVSLEGASVYVTVALPTPRP